MIEGVIFDLDGVICSTDEYHYQAWKAIADQEGIAFDRDINNQLRGISRMDCLNVILKRSSKTYTEDEKKALADRKNDIYQNFLRQMTERDCRPGVRSTLDWLKKKGIKIAIGSSSKNTKIILKQLKLDTTFDAIVDGNDITRAKPDPEVFLLAAERLNLFPSHVLVIEDAYSGIQAAKKGGFVSCGLEEAANYYQTDYPLKTIADVILILSKFNGQKE